MIKKKVEVPKEIIKAANDNTLAVFIGAGVSRIVGCIGWDELAKNLVNLCFNLKKEDAQSCINFKEKDRLLQENNHKKTITICHDILEKNGYQDAFYTEMEKALNPNEGFLSDYPIYDEIFGLRGLFITTNADQIFDTHFRSDRVIFSEAEFSPENIDRNKLYHIHGLIAEPDTLVFTVRQYIRRYNSPDFKKFLEEIFKRYTVLFLGYGMSEFELLDFIITKFDDSDKKEQKHFILIPYYAGEDNILGFDQAYYNEMGIRVLGFEFDEKGYAQLYFILKEWNREINQVSKYLYDTFQEIEKAVHGFNEEEAAKILQLIKNDKPQQVHLFDELSKSDSACLWLELLLNEGYFSPEKNPEPRKVAEKEDFYTIEKWHVLDYLKSTAKQNEKNPDTHITSLLHKIIEGIIDYKDAESERVDNSTTDSYLVEIIFSLPIDAIGPKHINWVGSALSTKWGSSIVDAKLSTKVFPKLIAHNAKNLLLLLLDIILDYKEGEKPGHDKFEPVVERYWLRKALERHKKGIANICGIEALNIAFLKMRSLISDNSYALSYMWIPTIENHSQARFKDKYEIQLVHFVRDILKIVEPHEAKPFVKKLIEEKHSIFRRIALHLITVHYNDFKDLFWGLESPLQDEDAEHEIYELLKINCVHFSDEQIHKIIEWVEAIRYDANGENKNDLERSKKAASFQKKEWLSAILDTRHPEVLTEYRKYDSISPGEIEHPGHRTWSETFVGTISPIESEKLMNMSNSEIAAYLNEFKEDGRWRSPSVEGLSFSFKTSVKENPEKFSSDLMPFEHIPNYYKYDLLSGFTQAFKEEKDFSLDNVLKYIEKLILSMDFWSDKKKEKGDRYRDWIISQVLNFIQEGTRNDSNAFDPKFMDRIERLLFAIAEHVDKGFFELEDLFEAMLFYSLRHARLYKNEKREKWVTSVKEYFSHILNNEIKPTESFYKVLGKMLVSVAYLDKDWIAENVNKIFPSENDEYWKAAFSRYINYTQRVYKEIYLLLKENGLLSKAVETIFDDESVREHLVQHVCISYLSEWEELENSDSLINILLKRENPAELKEICRFINGADKDKIVRVRALWDSLVGILKKDERKFRMVISDLSRWISLVDDIDEDVFVWLRFSAGHVEANYNAYFFIEHLNRLVAENSMKVSDLMIDMLNSGIYPDFDLLHIKNIVETLYEKGIKEKADRICNIYMANRLNFLRDIYEKYNKA